MKKARICLRRGCDMMVTWRAKQTYHCRCFNLEEVMEVHMCTFGDNTDAWGLNSGWLFLDHPGWMSPPLATLEISREKNVVLDLRAGIDVSGVMTKLLLQLWVLQVWHYKSTWRLQMDSTIDLLWVPEPNQTVTQIWKGEMIKNEHYVPLMHFLCQ
jgi:hypothetical protein